MTRYARHTAMALLLYGIVSPTAEAHAAKGDEDPLAGQPAVRHRRQLREHRFEIGPAFGFTLGRSYRHAFMVGAKLQYHITDYLAVGGEFQYGVNWDAGLVGEIEQTYARDEAEFDTLRNRLSDVQMAGDVRLVFTPFSGKLALFSALFMAYDFYVFGGFGMGMLANGTDEEGVDEANEGFRPGVAWGVGVHLFANDFVAIGIELKDLIFEDNETGGDLTRGLSEADPDDPPFGPATGDDRSFVNHFFVGLNVTFLLPTEAKISD
jgi:outer membrane beta-barrel protein